MDTTDFTNQLEDLEANIDDLTTTLAPLLSQPLSKQTSTLPLLDRAKLHILHAYAIESLLFSALLTSGVDAKAHPIFKELARLKGYFGKVKDAEEIRSGPAMKLDKGAAGRFIRAGLSGNEKVDKERKERVARERAKAKLLAARGKGTKKKFDSDGEEIVTPKAAEEASGAEEKRTEARATAEPTHEEDKDEHFSPTSPYSHTKKRKHPTDPDTPDPPLSREERKTLRRAEKAARKTSKAHGYPPHKPEELLVPKKDEKGPRTHSETFKALLEGLLPKRVKGGKGREREKKGK